MFRKSRNPGQCQRQHDSHRQEAARAAAARPGIQQQRDQGRVRPQRQQSDPEGHEEERRMDRHRGGRHQRLSAIEVARQPQPSQQQNHQQQRLEPQCAPWPARQEQGCAEQREGKRGGSRHLRRHARRVPQPQKVHGVRSARVPDQPRDAQGEHNDRTTNGEPRGLAGNEQPGRSRGQQKSQGCGGRHPRTTGDDPGQRFNVADPTSEDGQGHHSTCNGCGARHGALRAKGIQRKSPRRPSVGSAQTIGYANTMNLLRLAAVNTYKPNGV